ncbi:MAG: hypothetical protein NBV67_18435 [Tagaea sp.]|nr:hypothetical protein [Tagaea sp.]
MPNLSPDITTCLSVVPDGLRQALVGAFDSIVRNYREHRWGPAELDGGKFAEAAYCVIEGALSGSYGTTVSKPKNFRQACSSLEQKHPNGLKSLRILIPQVLSIMYEVRNNRNVGHLGADVDPNQIDALLILNSAKWVMAELIRILHTGSIDVARGIVERIADKTIPLVWEHDGVRRVLDPSLSYSDRTLILLYSANSAVEARKLFQWAEHSNWSMYKKSVLTPLHNKKHIEFDEKNETAQILPPGTLKVEAELLSAQP